MGYKDGEFRFSACSTEQVAISNSRWGTNYSAMHLRYSAADNIPAPQSRLSADERESDEYIRSNVNWVQYRDSDGASGFAYPAYCGVKDGKRRDLYFTIDAPAYTLTNAWLTVNALPPFTGYVPAGARVSLSLMGFADDPAANQDFVVTDGMFEGQTPIVLQDNVLRDGVAAGKSLFTRRVGQRDLIRALNARVKALKNVWADNRRGQKAVFRLAVEAAGGVDDWGFSIGSAATPGVEAFFEGVEYRKRIGIFVNTGFENGLENWTVPKIWEENQLAVAQDPVDSANKCLRMCVTNMADSVSGIEVYQERNDSELVELLLGRPFSMSYRVYMPSSSPITKKSDALTQFGYYLFWSRDDDGTGRQMEFGKTATHDTVCDRWHTVESPVKILPTNIKDELRFYLQFRFGEVDRVANDGATIYYDDITVEFEDFYDFPEEETTFMMIVR
jgi:hypothetical protein